MNVTGGTTDVTTYFVMRLAADGTAATGLTITDFDLQYIRTGAAPSAKQDATALAAIDSAHGDNKAYEVDATDAPGLYRVDWPDAAFAAGVRQVILTVKCATCFSEHQVIDIDPPVGAAASVTGAVGSVSVGGIVAASFGAGAITASVIADAAIDNATFAADVGSTAYGSNIIALAADKAIQNYDGPTNTEMVTAFTEIKGATWAATDSLEAIRDRGDVAWITGSGGGGDATEAKQDTIITHLSDIKGVGWTTETLVAIGGNIIFMDTVLSQTTEIDGGLYRFTELALALAPVADVGASLETYRLDELIYAAADAGGPASDSYFDDLFSIDADTWQFTEHALELAPAATPTDVTNALDRRGLVGLANSTCLAGSSGGVVLTNAAWTGQDYESHFLVFTSGTHKGHVYQISSISGSSPATIVVSPATVENVSAGDGIAVFGMLTSTADVSAADILDIADAVLDEATADHTIAGSVGAAIAQGGSLGSGFEEQEVHIKDQYGADVADADVYLTSDSAGSVKITVTKQTDSDGNVSFYVDPDCSYYVWAQKDGYQIVEGELWETT